MTRGNGHSWTGRSYARVGHYRRLRDEFEALRRRWPPTNRARAVPPCLSHTSRTSFGLRSLRIRRSPSIAAERLTAWYQPRANPR